MCRMDDRGGIGVTLSDVCHTVSAWAERETAARKKISVVSLLVNMNISLP